MEDEVKYRVFEKNARRHFGPQYLTVGETTVQWIFSIPEPNAVGTLDEHNNGIASVTFGNYGTEPECKVIAQDFSEIVYGPFIYRFSPNFSEDTIAYSKIKAAVIANVKTGDTFHVGCGLPMDGYMLGIHFLDPQNNLFVVVKSIKDSNTWRNDYLHVMKFEKEQHEDQQLVDTDWVMHIGKTNKISPDFPLYNTWFVHNHKLFVYDCDKTYRDRILCTDGRQSLTHPFSEIYNVNSNSIGKIKDIAIHPTLPFGVMIEERSSSDVLHGLIVLRWDTKDPDEQISGYNTMFESLAPLFGLEAMSLAYSSFSPCGNWYVVGCIAPDNPKNPHFIALPVDPEHPDLLVREDIVILGQVKGMTSLAWTSNPTSYVVSNGEQLHKWDLEELPNARVFAMPGEDDGGKKNASVFRRIGGVFGGKK
jgi:hypothetical protein